MSAWGKLSKAIRAAAGASGSTCPIRFMPGRMAPTLWLPPREIVVGNTWIGRRPMLQQLRVQVQAHEEQEKEKRKKEVLKCALITKCLGNLNPEYPRLDTTTLQENEFLQEMGGVLNECVETFRVDTPLEVMQDWLSEHGFSDEARQRCLTRTPEEERMALLSCLRATGSQMSVITQAKLYVRLKKTGMKLQEVALAIGENQQLVRNRMACLYLHKEVQDKLHFGQVDMMRALKAHKRRLQAAGLIP